MNIENLSTSRVLLIDDNPEEAIPILTALGQVGVGCVYVKGDKFEELPEKPVDGIRLVFLDMRLDEGGNQRNVLSKTIAVLKRCVPNNTMPLVVVCWTKHEDDIETFKKMVVRSFPGLKPGFIVGMPKPKRGKANTWKGILSKIRNKLKKYDALTLTWQWENVLHGAATDTIQTLADVSTHMINNPVSIIKDWQDGIFIVCQELVRAEAGHTVEKETASNALFQTMNELAIDRIQHSALDEPLSCAGKLIPKGKPALNLENISHLNEMILLEPIRKTERSCAPGVILISKGKAYNKRFCKRLGINNEELISSIIDILPYPEYKELKKVEGRLLEKKSKSSIEPSETRELKKVQNKLRSLPERISRLCREILIEISPSCDYAQDKRPVARFLAGLVISENIPKKCIKKNDSIYSFDPITIPSLKGAWRIVLSSRHIYSIANPEASNHPLASCRLRSHALSDLRIWAASRSARPGLISIRESD